MNNSPYFPWPNSYGYPPQKGITRYAEIAARFHASLLANPPYPDNGWNIEPRIFAAKAFDHADAFFAELMARESEASQQQAAVYRAINPHLFKDNP